MFNTWQALFRLRPVGEELRAELNRMLIQRLRIGVLLALVFIPSFVPLDYLRMPDHFAWAVTVRGTGCVLLLGLVVLLSIDAAERWADFEARTRGDKSLLAGQSTLARVDLRRPSRRSRALDKMLGEKYGIDSSLERLIKALGSTPK